MSENVIGAWPMNWLIRQLKRIPSSSNPSGLVYGTILSATLIAAESEKAVDYGGAVGGIAVAEVVYWLAIAYSEYAGRRVKEGESFEFAGLWRSAKHELAVLQSGIVPAAVIVVCWIVGAHVSTALQVAVYTAAGMIVVVELLIGIQTEETGRELVIDTFVGVVIGLLVLVIRVLVH